VLDSRIEKWRSWLLDRIAPQVYTAHLHRQVFRELSRITQAADLPPSYFFEYSGETYATSQALAIRRLADPNTRAVSLVRLLREMAADPTRLSRRFYVAMFEDLPSYVGDRAFTRTFAGQAGNYADPALIERDVDALNEGASKVKRYVDQHVAHADARARAAIPTFEDLNGAVDLIAALYRKYYNLLTADDILVEPVLDPNWIAVFRVPWIDSD